MPGAACSGTAAHSLTYIGAAAPGPGPRRCKFANIPVINVGGNRGNAHSATLNKGEEIKASWIIVLFKRAAQVEILVILLVSSFFSQNKH